LCLCTLGRYDEAASTLYAVLSVGPGWDWPTLIGLYPNVEVYTAQLRALEDYCRNNPQAATARFVLAYQYLTEGHLDAAKKMLKSAVALKPNDTFSAKLLSQLEANPPAEEGAPPAPAPAPEQQVPTDTAMPQGATISGTWTAQPAQDTTVRLTIQDGGPFTWEANVKGKTQTFSGTATLGAGVLTLVQEKGPVLVGHVSWKDPNHMTFRVMGDSPDSPGLTFSK
jgi:tetratricopeptide (TPR) repeat protein